MNDWPREEKRKKKYYRGSEYDLRGVERWLAGLASDGLELVEWNEFRDSMPRECRFYLEPAARDDGPTVELSEKRAALGWEYVCTTKNGMFYVWRGGALAHMPMPRQQTDSYCYRRVKKALRESWIIPAIYAAGVVIAAAIVAGSAPLLVRTLITLRPAAGIQALSLLLSAVLGSLASTRQNRDLRALRRAMEEGEHVRTLPRNRWVWIEKGISLICLLLVFALHITDRDLPETKEYADDPLPYLSAAQVGGGEKEWREVCRQRTVLGGTVSIVGEPPFGGTIGSWWTYGTELDFYAPRITGLAAPLAAELRDYFMDGSEETLTLDGFDEAYYAGFPIPKHMVPSYVKGEAAYRQFVILRRGGRVLFYRAEMAEDLRGHLSELAEIFAQYENA